jgi:hypothetical protein
MLTQQQNSITFDLQPEDLQAIEQLSGSSNRKVRLSGSITNGKLVIDNVGFADKEFSQAVFVPVNAPFKTAQLLTT